MTDKAVCQGCGTEGPRVEMFGVQDDLRCPTCARVARERLHPAKMQTVTFKKTTFVATKVLLGISIVLFVLTDFVFRSQQPAWLLGIGQSGRIWDGEWWRHIGSIFLHGGALHIMLNGMALWSLGRVIEMGWSGRVLLFLTLFTGVAAAAVHWIFSAPMPAVGISGAILGIVGFLWALKDKHPLARAVMTPRMQKYIIGFLAVCVVLTELNIVGIANAAHLGGLAAGFAFGLVWDHKARKVLIPLVIVACIGLVVAAQFVNVGKVELVSGKKVSRTEWRQWYLDGLTPDSPHRKPEPPTD